MRLCRHLFRVLSLVLCAVVGTALLTYCAPGYFADAREMDASHAAVVRSGLEQLHEQQSSSAALLRQQCASWLHGDLGQSRQFGIPVSALVRQRSGTSLKLLAAAVVFGWSFALLLAIPLSAVRARFVGLALAVATAALLAIPVGVSATLCLAANFTAPGFVLGLVIAVRDFKLLYRILGALWSAPFLLHARSQGFSTRQLVTAHIFPALKGQLFNMGITSLTLALSALVPVEVVFDYPGLGQLAWSAAMNRDLPVLVAVTALVAACVALGGLVNTSERGLGDARCA
jgi:peptide/nickel transport system permease protein